MENCKLISTPLEVKESSPKSKCDRTSMKEVSSLKLMVV
jgi:hypothetical protein